MGNGDLIKDASGNVGIGVTPSAWYTATGTKALQFGAGAFSSYSTTNFAMRQNAYSASGTATETYVNNGAASYYIQTAGAHSWATAPSGTAGNAITFTTAMTLDSSGNLGLGVTPSAWSTGKAIEVGNVGNAYWSAGIANAVLTSNVVYTSSAYKYANSAPSSQYQQYNGAHIWYTAASGTAGATITDFATAKMTLDASGGLKTLNTIGVGNATPSTSGAGITFPATQSASTDANTLDDYEEGTRTPNQGSGLTVVGAFSSSGTYTKVGRLVTVGGKIAGATSIALSAAGAVSSNLPFGPVITTHDYYMGSSTNGPNNISSSCLAYSTYIFATSAITASAAIYFTVTYMV